MLYIYCLDPLLDQCYIIVIFTYCFLASNVAGPVGGTIGSVFILIIVAFICSVTAIGIKKKRKRQNLVSDSIQQVDLQTISSPETIQRKNQTGLSRLLPNTTLNTMPQRQNQFPGNETESAHYLENNCRPPLSYSECNNTIGRNEALNVVANSYMTPYQLQKPAPQEGHRPSHQLACNTQKPNRGRQPNTSAALTSFATLPANKNIVKASRRQGSNVDNCQAPTDVQAAFDDPPYQPIDAAHRGSDCDSMEEHYEVINT